MVFIQEACLYIGIESKNLIIIFRGEVIGLDQTGLVQIGIERAYFSLTSHLLTLPSSTQNLFIALYFLIYCFISIIIFYTYILQIFLYLDSTTTIPPIRSTLSFNYSSTLFRSKSLLAFLISSIQQTRSFSRPRSPSGRQVSYWHFRYRLH